MATSTDRLQDSQSVHIIELPPDYSESAVSKTSAGSEYITEPPGPPEASSSSQEITRPLTMTRVSSSPATNFLTINRKNETVKGIYAINPTLPPPPGAVISKDNDGKDLNLSLKSTNGPVNCLVEIIKGVDTKGPARLHAESENGSVTLVIHDAQQNRFRLQAVSINGSVSIRIPSTYIGPISTMIKYGSLNIDTALRPKFQTISEIDEEGRFFLGDYISAGYENDETWLMDHIRVESHYGGVNIAFIEEDGGEKGKEASQKSFFSRLFG
ncbi:hypothetical protein M422DRAFT_268696 [Sphaerobolus stellatus SS14]|uniref:DUF7330 domain-containing protein n=1 Tax=Sphaerobolus stellatus (strain SS14) TaxID=990650 RepID=A0A0C9UXE2_SPHS4|nr:hypothetical protein M422DRAFT_268696 [Sphaerobolus stellatus SS14]